MPRRDRLTRAKIEPDDSYQAKSRLKALESAIVDSTLNVIEIDETNINGLVDYRCEN